METSGPRSTSIPGSQKGCTGRRCSRKGNELHESTWSLLSEVLTIHVCARVHAVTWTLHLKSPVLVFAITPSTCDVRVDIIPANSVVQLQTQEYLIPRVHNSQNVHLLWAAGMAEFRYYVISESVPWRCVYHLIVEVGWFRHTILAVHVFQPTYLAWVLLHGLYSQQLQHLCHMAYFQQKPFLCNHLTIPAYGSPQKKPFHLHSPIGLRRAALHDPRTEKRCPQCTCPRPDSGSLTQKLQCCYKLELRSLLYSAPRTRVAKVKGITSRSTCKYTIRRVVVPDLGHNEWSVAEDHNRSCR